MARHQGTGANGQNYHRLLGSDTHPAPPKFPPLFDVCGVRDCSRQPERNGL